jgi:hypothetical protein
MDVNGDRSNFGLSHVTKVRGLVVPRAVALLPPRKAASDDFEGRFREIIADPLNLLIERVPQAGCSDGTLVWLHNGLQVPVTKDYSYYGDFSRILVLNRGVHEPLEEYVFQEVLKHVSHTPVMLELGAYWAHYSMWLKLRRPAATSIMVEPDARALEAGRRNFALNNFSGEFIQEAVGRGYFGVDAFAIACDLGQLDILHADIQGYEVEMLAGASGLLTRHAISHLFVSTHSQELHGEVTSVLEGHGYRIEVSSDVEHETTSFDGFIYANSPNLRPLFANFHPLGRCEIAAANPTTLLASLAFVHEREGETT